jgi:DNA polymerase-3 subunit alpha
MSDFTSQFSKINLELHGVRLPKFKVPSKYKKQFKLAEDASNYDFLRLLCDKGFRKLGLEKDSEDFHKYVERVRHELSILKDLGFIDYVLLVWDVVNFCKKEDIPVGPGRGSAAGSMVLRLLEVTQIDPVKHDLYFERFVSKIRAKKKTIKGITYLDGSLMCDVDIDICYHNRPRVIKYLEEKFEGRTSKILTFNTLSGKLCMKECGKIVGSNSDSDMNMVSNMIPKLYGQVKDLEEAYEEVSDFKEWCDENYDSYLIALKLRGLIKNKGVHPSAISISYDEMDKSCPTELTKDKDSQVSSYDMNWVSMFNVKLDILGLRAVSVVDDICKQIGISPNEINYNDPFIYQNLQNLRTPHGLFQIEAETNFRVCQKVKPRNLDELSAVLALARPGALAFVDQYSNFTNNGVNESIHPFFDDILLPTGGVCLYQEQLMKMANKIGFSLDEAELLRRIVSKKKVSEARKWKNKIKDKIKKQNFDPEIGDVLWKILEDSASYSFNKSHSCCYAALAAMTIYLKFKHPKEFYLALLKMSVNEPNPIREVSKIHKEIDLFDIKLLPPHLIKSKNDFSIEQNDIRFGMLSIKGISDKSIDKLISFRGRYSDKFKIFEAAGKCGLNIGTLCALIQAGTLEGDLRQSRTKVVYEAQVWNTLTPREKLIVVNYGKEYNYDLVKIITLLTKTVDEKGKLIIKESRFATIKRKADKYKEIYNQNKKSEIFANWYYEKNLLGYTYNKSLRECFSDTLRGLITLRQVEERPIDNKVSFIGYVNEKVRQGTSRNGNRYLNTIISDETGSMKVLIFTGKMDKSREINGRHPKENDIVVIKGTKKDEVVFADVISIQNTKIYTKLSELKK